MIFGMAPRQCILFEAPDVETRIVTVRQPSLARNINAAGARLEEIIECDAGRGRKVAIGEIADGKMSELTPGLCLSRRPEYSDE